MEFGPVFRALMHNKTRFWLITLEVALTLAIVVNCVNLMLDMRNDFLRPTGLDEENLIVMTTEPFSAAFDEEEFQDSIREQDLARLQALPGVRAATGITAIPLSGGGSATGRRALGSELDNETAPYFVVTEGAVDTLGVEIAAGRNFVPQDFLYEEDDAGNPINRNVIVTRALGEALFPDGDALGQVIQNREGQVTNTIVGILERMHCSWPTSEIVERVMLFPGKPGNDRRMRYMVRTEPGAVEAVYSELEEAILAVEPGRIVTLRTLTEYKGETYSAQLALIKILGGVIVLLILVTSLGIVGLTAFSVTERIRQIGTRRALGATKVDIVRYFLIENWMITAIGLVLGTGMAFGLSYALTKVADAPKLDMPLLVAGIALIWLLGILAALAPALRATTVPPEIATRTV